MNTLVIAQMDVCIQIGIQSTHYLQQGPCTEYLQSQPRCHKHACLQVIGGVTQKIQIQKIAQVSEEMPFATDYLNQT